MIELTRQVPVAVAPRAPRRRPRRRHPPRPARGARRRCAATCASAPRPAAPRPWSWRPRPPPCSTAGPTSPTADVRAVAAAALRHRLVLGYEAVGRRRRAPTTSSPPSSTAVPDPPARPAAGAALSRRAGEPRCSNPRCWPGWSALQLGTRRRLAGHFAGEHRSPRHGTSLDFADYREYHPGDDFRRIDYSSTPASTCSSCKLFEAEDDLTCACWSTRRRRWPPATSCARPRGSPPPSASSALVRRDVVTRPHLPAATGPRPASPGGARRPPCSPTSSGSRPAATPRFAAAGRRPAGPARPAGPHRRGLRPAHPEWDDGLDPPAGPGRRRHRRPRPRPPRSCGPTWSATSTWSTARPAAGSP